MRRISQPCPITANSSEEPAEPEEIRVRLWAFQWIIVVKPLGSTSFCCCIASVVSDSVRPHRRKPTRLPRPWNSPGKNTGVGCHFLLQCREVKSESEVAQSCPTLSDPMDCSLPGSSIHGIFQARVLEWGAIAFSIYLFQNQLKDQPSGKTGQRQDPWREAET